MEVTDRYSNEWKTIQGRMLSAYDAHTHSDGGNDNEENDASTAIVTEARDMSRNVRLNGTR